MSDPSPVVVPPVSDRSAAELDDHLDRDELRSRYYGLLQELRVLLPGVQILVAFLLTVPFAARFGQIDSTERALFGLALMSSALSVTAFVGPIAFHRFGHRESRSARLVWAIRLARLGLTLLGVSLATALVLVVDVVFGAVAALACAIVTIGSMVAIWVVLPRMAGATPAAGPWTLDRPG
jgi:hypothetical protein